MSWYQREVGNYLNGHPSLLDMHYKLTTNGNKVGFPFVSVCECLQLISASLLCQLLQSLQFRLQYLLTNLLQKFVVPHWFKLEKHYKFDHKGTTNLLGYVVTFLQCLCGKYAPFCSYFDSVCSYLPLVFVGHLSLFVVTFLYYLQGKIPL